MSQEKIYQKQSYDKCYILKLSNASAWMFLCWIGGYFESLFWAAAAGYTRYFQNRYFFELFTKFCFVFVNTTRVDWNVEILLYFSHILFNFWMKREWFYVVFVVFKNEKKSVVKSVFYFLRDFILRSQSMMHLKLVYHTLNRLVNKGWSNLLQWFFIRRGLSCISVFKLVCGEMCSM